VESDRRIIKELIPRLRDSYITDTAYNSYNALVLSESNPYDTILIDDECCDIEGSELCRMLREIDIDSPIALLLSKKDGKSVVRSLDAGADVVIQKPFSVDEVIAQINVLARRNSNNKNCMNTIKVGKVCFDMKNKVVYVGGIRVYLRRKEFDLLEYLAIHRGRIISKEEILEHVWERGMFVFCNTVEVHVRSIRLKFLNEAGINIIKTYRGFGYEIET